MAISGSVSTAPELAEWIFACERSVYTRNLLRSPPKEQSLAPRELEKSQSFTLLKRPQVRMSGHHGIITYEAGKDDGKAV